MTPSSTTPSSTTPSRHTRTCTSCRSDQLDQLLCSADLPLTALCRTTHAAPHTPQGAVAVRGPACPRRHPRAARRRMPGLLLRLRGKGPRRSGRRADHARVRARGLHRLRGHHALERAGERRRVLEHAQWGCVHQVPAVPHHLPPDCGHLMGSKVSVISLRQRQSTPYPRATTHRVACWPLVVAWVHTTPYALRPLFV
jgi:hypothetical protein